MKASIEQLEPYVPEKPLATLQAELGLTELVRLSANAVSYTHLTLPTTERV